MNIKDTIQNKLEEHIDVKYIEISDTTGRHVNHHNFDGGHHLSAIIVSNNFISIDLIDRHRMVYNALSSLIKNEIHAFSMKTFTESEWNSHVT